MQLRRSIFVIDNFLFIFSILLYLYILLYYAYIYSLVYINGNYGTIEKA